MVENKIKSSASIDLGGIFKKVWSNRRLFIKVWVVTFILSCIWILPQPRYYRAEVSIAPETSEDSDIGSLAALASNFGVNIDKSHADAINPKLYPDLFESTKFLTGLFGVIVKTEDGTIETDYYSYLKDHQKQNVLFFPLRACQSLLSSGKEEATEQPSHNGKRFDPFKLSKEESDILAKVRGNIKCNFSMVTEVVTITVTDQDPLVCALLADSIKEHLQHFITDYRTKKARDDYEHYKRLTDEAKDSYEKSLEEYISLRDANTHASLQSVVLKLDAMDMDVKAKYNIYMSLNTRLEAAMAKVQERTPAFTELINATVPTKPAGPKRMFFVAVMLFLSTIGTIVYLNRKSIKEWL